MMRHSNSLFISIILHLFLLVSLFASYKYIFKSSQNKKQDTLVCVQLSTLSQTRPKKETITPIKHLQTHKKTTKKKEIKKRVKKTRVKKQVIKKIKIKKIKKVPTISKDTIKKPTPKLPQTQVSQQLKKTMQKPIIKSVPKQTSEEVYVDANIKKIVELLQNNLYYPRRARRRGIQGDVRVKFHLSTDATISQVTVLSSDNAILSRGAIQTIENLSTQFPHPKEELTLTLPISYHFKH